jgi:hypothetical protein
MMQVRGGGTHFDVVVVPDFSGNAAGAFEVRTLLFLGSWLDHGGAGTRQLPLHIAAIGETPASVRSLADRCGASITAHDAMGELFLNKLRGLEIEARTSQVLLVDVDTVILRDISPLGDLGSCLALAPDNYPQVRPRAWDRIYGGLGLDPPAECMASLLGETQTAVFGRPVERRRWPGCNSMPPLFNGGVMFVPAVSDLRITWECHQRLIAEIFRGESPDDTGWILGNDQVGLSTAVTALRQEGVPFRRLPDAYNARDLHLYARTLPLEDMAIFHAIGFCRRTPADARAVRREIDRYSRSLREVVLRKWGREGALRFPGAGTRKRLIPAMRDVSRLRATLLRLFERYVVPALPPARS